MGRIFDNYYNKSMCVYSCGTRIFLVVAVVIKIGSYSVPWMVRNKLHQVRCMYLFADLRTFERR